jgi:Zn-dependent alcohol dehydrogenase
MLVGSKGNNAVGKHNDISINGRFFGQSSFSNLSIISEGAVVNVSDLVHGEEQLKLMAPLGCGFQTGAGSLTNLASVRK